MFTNLTMLAGIAGALVPLVLHMLSRSRYRTVDWGAMMFLTGGDAAVSQSARLRQFAILAIRMLIVAALAMALAQPIARGRWGALGRDARVGAVIVLDCSASMGLDENGKTRFEMAQSAVLNVLETLRENRVSVVVLGREAEALAQPTMDLQQLAQQVMSLGQPTGRADLAVGLNKAADILNRMGESTREIYVITDRQASGWREVGTEGFRSAWAQRIARPDTQTRFFVVAVGTERSENLAIESVELMNPPAIAGQPAEIEVKVHNYGKSARGGVELKVDDSTNNVALSKAVTIAIAADATTTTRVPVRFAHAGSRVVTASLGSGGLRFDDRMEAAIDVMEPIRVLIISGDERGRALQNESDFLRIALAPRTADARLRNEQTPVVQGDPCRVEVVMDDAWDTDKLRNYQVVVLANVPDLTAGQQMALEQFVAGGGGLWIAPGNLARVENYNDRLYRDGAGLMPARLLPATAEDGSEATTVQGIADFDHPALRFLKGRSDPVPAVTVGRYFPAEPRGREARVLAQYASGRPMLVENTTAHTRVMLITTPLDADWSTLPLSSFFLPMVQSTVRHLTAEPTTERNVAPGQPIVARIDPTYRVKSVHVRPPAVDGREVPIVPIVPARGEVRYNGTRAPGVYRMVIDGDIPWWAKNVHFVVQTPRVESDLTPLTEAQWASLGASLEFEFIDPVKRPIGSAVSVARAGRELWLALLGVVLALCVAELAVTRWWSAEGIA